MIPSFLTRFDAWLLAHQPVIWRTKIHYLLFYLPIAAVILYIAGRSYPMQIADYIGYNHNPPTASVMGFVGILSLCLIVFWWFQIRKFPKPSGDPKSFMTEIGIYTLSFALFWWTFMAYPFGISYKQAYGVGQELMKQKDYIRSQGYFTPAYVPHVESTKFQDFKSYFYNGEKILYYNFDRLKEIKKIEDIANDGRGEGDYIYYTSSQYSDDNERTSYIISWEYDTYKTSYKIPLNTPPTPVILSDIARHRTEDDTAVENAVKDRITSMTGQQIKDFINNVPKEYFKYANFTPLSFKEGLNEDGERNRFIESLNEGEKAHYRQFMRDLIQLLPTQKTLYRDETATYSGEKAKYTITFFQLMTQRENEAYNYIETSEKEKLFHTLSSTPYNEYSYDNSPSSAQHNFRFYENIERNVVKASGLMTNFIRTLDPVSLQFYYNHIKKVYPTEFDAVMPSVEKDCRNYYKTHFPTPLSGDSLRYPDFYFENKVSKNTLTDIFRREYAQYRVNKYTTTDLPLLTNLLETNGFVKASDKAFSPMTYKELLLSKGDDLKSAIENCEQKQADYIEMRPVMLGILMLLGVLAAALLFYLLSQSKPIVIFGALFGCAIYFSLVTLVVEGVLRGMMGRSYITELIIVFHVTFFSIILLKLIFAKYQTAIFHYFFNGVILSGVIAGLFTVSYFNEYRYRRYDSHGTTVETFWTQYSITSAVVLGYVILYFILSYLYKRYLTLPHQR